MKFLLVGVNASFSHTCLAVRQLSVYADIPFLEFTINQPCGEILRGIVEPSPDVVLFSTYIWNAEIITKLIPDLKKILPNVIIGAGGPEFGLAAEVYLNKLSALDFVVKGEGEETLKELSECKKLTQSELSKIKGIYYRDFAGMNQGDGSLNKSPKIIYTGERPLLCDLSALPFSYPELIKPEGKPLPEGVYNKIYYYESSRGCPFKCSYCMSSLDLRVRFKPLEQVFEELQIFLDDNIPLVKFVDRTYNLQPERYIAIWNYILSHHNGITMFHFEIEAEFLTEEALDFLQKVPAGVMQFEIGVQSANKNTLKAICRSENVEKLAENVKRIPRTIHQHLDLIAGLPEENLESFGRSFDFVMDLKPDAMQLGFLKILHGTQMEAFASKNGWKWMENPVYETFSTPFMSYQDMLFLKDLEIVLDAYWNSGIFSAFMNYVSRHCSYWQFFSQITKLAQEEKVFAAARREAFWFEFAATHLEQLQLSGLEKNVLYELLRYDFVRRGKQGNFPQWYEHHYDKTRHRLLLEENEGLENSRIGFAFSEYEVFNCNVLAEDPENHKDVTEVLLKYQRRTK